MQLSTGIQSGRALQSISAIIGRHLECHTITRPTTSRGSLDETTETTDEHSEYLWLFQPTESVATELVGERVEGSLGGLAVADGNVDLQKDDRLSHGGVDYEVDTIVGHPHDGDPSDSSNTEFWVISFTRVQ